jgi:predicted cupin superfamily sugar epimerase
MDISSMNKKQKSALCRELIKKYNMAPLPFEGGYYVETFRSKTIIENSQTTGKKMSPRRICSIILYMITRESFSRLHRLPTEEIYSFYFGDTVNMINISKNGNLSFFKLGSNYMEGQKFQHIVPGDCWQASYLDEDGVFAMMGTTMSPAFEISDFEDALNYKQEIMSRYPEHGCLLEKLI